MTIVYMPGRGRYSEFEGDAVEAGFKVTDLEQLDGSTNPHYTLDQVVAMNTIKKVVEGMEGQLDRIQQLWRTRHQQLGDQLQLSEMEQAMRTVGVKPFSIGVK